MHIRITALFHFILVMFATSFCWADALTVIGPDYPVDGNNYSASGGCAPYSWSISKGTIDANSGTVGNMSNQCGKAVVTVTDACGNSATKSVNIPNGSWQPSSTNPGLQNPWVVVGQGTYYVSPILKVSYAGSSVMSCCGCWGSRACKNCPAWGTMIGSPGSNAFTSYQYEYTQPNNVNNCDGVGQDVFHYFNYSVYELKCGSSGNGNGCVDNDNDGYYAKSDSCPNGTDPDDNDPNVYPGAPEICDGKDNNGNGLVDEGCWDSCLLGNSGD